jgi:hypothetical protein
MIFRIAALLAALVPAAAPAPAFAQADIPEVPFYVDSGDGCPRGYTQGVLTWHFGPDEDYVDVVGDVVDRVDPTDPACGDDGMSTYATFAVYEIGIPEGETWEADNGELRVAMPVDGNTTEGPDPIVIQVCRASDTTGKRYCGKVQKFSPPTTVAFGEAAR